MIRTALRCAALLLLVATACSKESAASSRSGISGVVHAGPTCPVETLESPCPDRPVADARVSAKKGKTVRETQTDDKGAFKLRLQPGTYDVTATSKSVAGCATVRIEVTKQRYSNVSISCDTGIR